MIAAHLNQQPRLAANLEGLGVDATRPLSAATAKPFGSQQIIQLFTQV
jgi:hypothetical protein